LIVVGENLASLINRKGQDITVADVMLFLIWTLKGLKSMHDLKIIHRYVRKLFDLILEKRHQAAQHFGIHNSCRQLSAKDWGFWGV
jgi:hypothetical protein